LVNEKDETASFNDFLKVHHDSLQGQVIEGSL